MWSVIAAWLICLASLSLPWPGIILVVVLCCVAFFELASPAAWSAGPRQNRGANAGVDPPANTGPSGVKSGREWRDRSPLAALAEAFHFMTERLRGGGSGGEMEELATMAAAEAAAAATAATAAATATAVGAKKKTSSARTPAQAGPTFLKGSVGSFSRGGLMVTQDGRVIYKVNQDRGLISHPSLNKARHTIFGVFDGHGENGEQVAAYTMREVPRRLELHPDALRDPTSALEDIFLDINANLSQSGINAVFGGCTAVVALVRGPRVWVANAGDSRALVAGKGEDGGIVARALSRDQNPDSPGERERIEAMGGYVSDPEEVGASARVWLDSTRTLVGLAMARSIGDLAVKRVGVIALPEVTEYTLTPQDEFLVLASDGVWEFIDSQEAAEVVQRFFEKGEDAAGACKGLMELANRRWSDMVGDYRDDITATVVRLPFLPPTAAAEAAAANARTSDATAVEAAAAGGEGGGAGEGATEKEGAAAGGEQAEEAHASASSTTSASAAAVAEALISKAERRKPSSTAADGTIASPAPASACAPLGKTRTRRRRLNDNSHVATSSGVRAASPVGSSDADGSAAAGGSDAAAHDDDGNSGSSSGAGAEVTKIMGVKGLAAESVSGGTAGVVVACGVGKLREGDDIAAAAGGGVTSNAGEESTLSAMDAPGGSEDLLSTSAVTPEATSEEGEGEGKEEKGGEDEDDLDGIGGDDSGVEGEGEKENDETTRLLSATSEVLAERKGSIDVSTAAAAAVATDAAPSAPESTVVLTPAFLSSQSATAVTTASTVPSAKTTTALVDMEEDEENDEKGDGEVGEDGEREYWEWDFGARERRQPSREMREASREFPSGSLDALVA